MLIFQELIDKVYKETKGYINHEKKTKKQFRQEIKECFKGITYLPCQIAFEFRRYGEWWTGIIIRTTLGYGYYIPQNERENKRLKKRLKYEKNEGT